MPKTRNRLDGLNRCYLCRYYGTKKKWARINGHSRAVCKDATACDTMKGKP